MIAAERRVHIMETLNKKSIVNLKEIAAELGISEITVRRDFEKLENAGKLKRVPGGAALENYLDSAEMTMKQKTSINLDAKRTVAKHAAGLVREGDCVFLDGGTSIAQAIDFLASKRVTIVTYSQLVLNKLVNPVAAIHVIGGVYMPHYGMNVGPEAQEALKRYHFDVAMIGCSGVVLENNMSYTTNMDSLIIKHIAMENSDKNILLIDASKFNKPSYLKVKELDAFDKIICDKQHGIAAHEKIEFV